MDWIVLALVGAFTAFLTLVACWWWFGRKLTALRRQLEHDLPTVPASVPSLDRPRTSSDVEQDLTAQSVERLERMLGESEAEWPRAQPFLDTSPLTHEVDEQASNVGRGERYG